MRKLGLNHSKVTKSEPYSLISLKVYCMCACTRQRLQGQSVLPGRFSLFADRLSCYLERNRAIDATVHKAGIPVYFDSYDLALGSGS